MGRCAFSHDCLPHKLNAFNLMLLNPATDMGMKVNCGLIIHFTYVDNDASWIFHDACAHFSEAPLKVSLPGSLVLEASVVSFADFARL